MLLSTFLSMVAITQSNIAPNWLEGCWVDQDKRSFEFWSSGVDGHFFGHGYTLGNNGQLQFFEHLRIEYDGQGGILYTAYPSGQVQTEFKGHMETQSSFAVTKPDHDFPQKIQYSIIWIFVCIRHLIQWI